MTIDRRLWITALFVVAIGCGNNNGSEANGAALRQARTCGDLLNSLRADALAKVDLEVASFVDQEYYGRFGGIGGGPAVLEDFGAPTAGPEGDTTNGAAGPDGVSDTNLQVASVDEADIVKVGDDGRTLYVIRDKGLYRFVSWPAADTSKIAYLEIEGFPMEMFIHDDRAVVFSSVYELEGFDDETCGGGGGGPVPLADVAYYCGRSYVKVTSVDLTAEEELRTTRELYFEGWYLSSRRHEDVVRAVVQGGLDLPESVPYIWEFLSESPVYPETRAQREAAAAAWATVAKAAIAETALEDWVPVHAERVGGEIQQLPVQCDGYYSPAPGLTQYGLTQIVGFDSQVDKSELRIASIMGSASQVYANADVMVLAQPEWAWAVREGDQNRTAVHRFEVPPGSAVSLYSGSGFVPGFVVDQFSIDEKAGVIRLATTRTRSDNDIARPDIWIPPVTDNLVTTLGLQGRELVQLGQTPPIAEGESITSARFVDNTAYLVTFLRVDPLFAIDLTNPANPTVLGELKIPGFSDYMHPLGDDHLLTIGRDIDENTQQDFGVALQIFDVSDPTKLALVHKELVGEGYSEANQNHKAFNFYADKGLLAFPFVNWNSEISSTLELWSVDVEDGIQHLGAVDHSSLITAECPDWGGPPAGGVPIDEAFYEYCDYLPQISRGVFIDAYIYSISYGGVLVHDVRDLTELVASAGY